VGVKPAKAGRPVVIPPMSSRIAAIPSPASQYTARFRAMMSLLRKNTIYPIGKTVKSGNYLHKGHKVLTKDTKFSG
jgi:hypothetical protein